MGWFDAFRDDGFNTYYGTKRNPVIFDLTLVLIVFFTAVISTAIVILVIGSRGRERWTTLVRCIMSLHTGVSLLVTLTGLGWQTAEIHSMCSYTASYHGEIQATLGVNIGLKYTNITLRGLVNATEYAGRIDYNERFTHDRVTDMAVEYKNALKRGLPWPIIAVLEYITLDMGDIRWMRGIHESGHFTYILLWCALVMWAASNILIGFVVPRGALLWMITGFTMVTAHIIYHLLQPVNNLEIPFKDDVIKLSYGWCFWLNLVSGIITMATGITLFVFYYISSDKVNALFILDTTYLHEDLDIKYSGPLEICTPMTQRRKSLIPHTYSNQAFVPTTSHESVTSTPLMPSQRSKSFDFGHLTSCNFQTGSNTAPFLIGLNSTHKAGSGHTPYKDSCSSSILTSINEQAIEDEYIDDCFKAVDKSSSVAEQKNSQLSKSYSSKDSINKPENQAILPLNSKTKIEIVSKGSTASHEDKNGKKTNGSRKLFSNSNIKNSDIVASAVTSVINIK